MSWEFELEEQFAAVCAETVPAAPPSFGYRP
jgi:hypothetical protein